MFVMDAGKKSRRVKFTIQKVLEGLMLPALNLKNFAVNVPKNIPGKKETLSFILSFIRKLRRKRGRFQLFGNLEVNKLKNLAFEYFGNSVVFFLSGSNFASECEKREKLAHLFGLEF